jgi:hypothetical protein
MSREELIRAAWLFASGAVIALLRSIVDGTRRSFLTLLAACFFGGLGAWLAGFAFRGAWFAPFAIGAAAVMTEHLALGLYRLSVRFSEDPMAFIDKFWSLGQAMSSALAAFAAGGKSKDDGDKPPKS